MKTMIKILPAVCLLSAGPLAAMEVHEWGTFTTFAGSSGRPLAWYQPSVDQAKLPRFVQSNSGRTKASMARVRMETPVIYFYPITSGNLTVEAAFLQGEITESYPSPNLTETGTTRWTGTLHPPSDPVANSYIPTIENDHPEEPYAAARAVPEAWIFKSTQHKLQDPPLAPEAEKFIFYRGAGDTVPTITASVDLSNHITLNNTGPHSYPVNIALRVANGKAVWQILPQLAPQAVGESQPSSTSATLTGEERDLTTVENELISHFQTLLEQEGLTPDEAAAMVETWRTVWFREEGLRVFTILPRPWIDEILPLKITPSPTAITRVFVARLEILSPVKEDKLIALLNTDTIPNTAVQQEFRDLHLGRFGQGALHRSIELENHRLMTRFLDLQQATKISQRIHDAAESSLSASPAN